VIEALASIWLRKEVNRNLSGKKKPVVIYRDSGTGQFVTEKYAEKHKGATEKEKR
jgi:hypothetical protein